MAEIVVCGDCKFRGKVHELNDGNCPRCGKKILTKTQLKKLEPEVSGEEGDAGQE